MKKNITLSRRLGVLAAVCIAMGALTACNTADEGGKPAVADEQTGNTTEETGNTTEEGITTEEMVKVEDTGAAEGGSGLDNFDVESASAAEFAQEIQKAVADADITELAELMTFPNYVSVYEENGGVVNTKDEFTAIGADRIFTKEMQESVANADVSNLQASMAGFLVVSASDNAAPSITFGMVDGELKITGINY